MAEFVTAYENASGRKVRVPAHFLDNPALGRGLSKTPRQKAKDAAAGAPKRSPRKRAAKPHQRAAKKQAAATPAPTTTPAPAAGDEKE